jgi:hypothetical protein
VLSSLFLISSISYACGLFSSSLYFLSLAFLYTSSLSFSSSSMMPLWSSLSVDLVRIVAATLSVREERQVLCRLNRRTCTDLVANPCRRSLTVGAGQWSWSTVTDKLLTLCTRIRQLTLVASRRELCNVEWFLKKWTPLLCHLEHLSIDGKSEKESSSPQLYVSITLPPRRSLVWPRSLLHLHLRHVIVLNGVDMIMRGRVSGADDGADDGSAASLGSVAQWHADDQVYVDELAYTSSERAAYEKKSGQLYARSSLWNNLFLEVDTNTGVIRTFNRGPYGGGEFVYSVQRHQRFRNINNYWKLAEVLASTTTEVFVDDDVTNERCDK